MATKRPKTVMTMNVNVEGFRERRDNKRRIAVAIQLIEAAAKAKIDCVCFPAGYLIAKNLREIPIIDRPIVQRAKQLKISFIIGIDTQAINNPSITSADCPAMLRLVKEGNVPCFLTAYSAERGTLHLYQQRTCTHYQAENRMASEWLMEDRNTMHLGDGQSFQIILCGEIYDNRLLDEKAPKAGVIFGHTTMSRLSRTLRLKSQRGFSLINTEHRTGRGGLIFNFDRGYDMSVPSRPIRIADARGLWIDAVVWTLDGRGFWGANMNPENLKIYEK
jgi:hypothetical protein